MSSEHIWLFGYLNIIFVVSPVWITRNVYDTKDFTNQNVSQFGNTKTEKEPGREQRHEHGKKQS